MRLRELICVCAAVLCAFSGGYAAAAPSAPPPRISAEAFGALPFFYDPEISPNGRKLIAKSLVGESASLLIVDLSKEELSPLRKEIPYDRTLLWARWAGDNKVLISLRIPTKLMGVELPTSRLFVYDLPSNGLRSVADNVGGLDGDNVIHVDPTGTHILLSSQKSIFETPGVWRVDLQTMKSEQLVKPHPQVWNWFADPSGIVRAGIGTESRRWWVLYRGPGETKFRKIAKGSVGGKEQESDIDAMMPITGSDKGYAIAGKQTGRYSVYHYDFATDTLGAPVFEHPEVDIDSTLHSAATGEVEAIRYVDDRDRILWLQPEMKKVQARIDRAFPNTVNRVVSRNSDGKVMVVWVGGASDPGTYYVFDSAKGAMRELAKPYSDLETARLAPVQAVKYTARDGLTIPAYLTLPEGRDPKGLPLIVMPHGGPFVRDKWTYDPWVQFLANRGYAVLQPNFRGSTGYGRSFVQAGEGEWGRKMQDDVDDGVRWLTRQGTADPKRVCIMGASYGGYAALWAAARNPDLYRCAVSFAGISDMRSMLRYNSRQFAAHRYYRDWRDRVKGHEKFDLETISPLRAVDRINIPILLAHGSADSTVPAAQSVKLHEALKKAGKQHDYVIYKDEGHNLSEVANSVDFLKRVEAFLGKHNPVQ